MADPSHGNPSLNPFCQLKKWTCLGGMSVWAFNRTLKPQTAQLSPFCSIQFVFSATRQIRMENCRRKKNSAAWNQTHDLSVNYSCPLTATTELAFFQKFPDHLPTVVKMVSRLEMETRLNGNPKKRFYRIVKRMWWTKDEQQKCVCRCVPNLTLLYDSQCMWTSVYINFLHFYAIFNFKLLK